MENKKNHSLSIPTNRKALTYNINERDCTTGKCPSPENLVLAARMELQLKERLKIINHIDKCDSCALEFLTIIKIIKKEKEFLEKIEKFHI